MEGAGPPKSWASGQLPAALSPALFIDDVIHRDSSFCGHFFSSLAALYDTEHVIAAVRMWRTLGNRVVLESREVMTGTGRH